LEQHGSFGFLRIIYSYNIKYRFIFFTYRIIACVLFGLSNAVSLNVECEYEKKTWDVFSPYYCDVQNNVNVVLNEGLTINSALGTHNNGMNNNDVTCFIASSKNFQFFPKDLDKIFNNLEGIVIADSNIREVHQSDLRPFTNLVQLGLHINKIEIIEEGLFEYNTYLKVISLRNNKIKQIHSKVFNNLSQLVTLRLLDNQCINKDSQLNSTAVTETIKHAKIQCTIPEQLDIGMEIKSLENDVNHFKLEDYEANNTKNEENFAKIETKIKDLGLPKTHELNVMLDKVHIVKVPFVVSLFKEIQNSNQKLREDLKACEASNQDLSEQVSAIQEELKSFKSEVFLGFKQIFDKIDEISGKIENDLAENIENMSINLQNAQNQAFSDMNDKIKSIENSLYSI